MAVALNVPVTVTIRIEGKNATIFEGTIMSNGHDVRIPAGSVAHPCDGTNGNEHPFPVPTVTAALDTLAPAAAGIVLDGTYYPQFEDWLITRIADRAGNDESWRLLLNSQAINVGGSQQRVQQGDALLFALVANDNQTPVVLKLKGPRAGVVAGVTVNVINAVTRVAVAGATVTGGRAPVVTNNQGNATVNFEVAGVYTLQANIANGIRSERLNVTVT